MNARKLLLALALLPLAAKAQSPAEQTLLDSANQARAQQGLPPLAWDAALSRAAHAHAQFIVRNPGPAEHQYQGEPDLLTRTSQAGAHFSTVSENVAGNGASTAQIHQAWMHSPVHRANLLDPELNVVGIAVAESHGYLYAVEDFAHSVPNLAPNSVDQQVLALFAKRGVQPSAAPTSHQDAHTACTTGSAPAGTRATVMQWEGPDITQIPDTLLQSMPASRIHAIAAASCAPKQPQQGFTTYHVAVLIY